MDGTLVCWTDVVDSARLLPAAFASLLFASLFAALLLRCLIVLQVVDGSLLHVLVQFLLVLSTWPSENILMDVLAVMVRSSVLREDGGHLAP